MPAPGPAPEDPAADWERRVVGRSLRAARARSIDRAAALIRAATVLVERSGADTFTVQDVADEAGQSLRTLYQYFESKDDLLLAVFEEVMITYARVVRTSIAGLDDPMERLAGALIAMARLPALTPTDASGGLARLRLRLAQVDPDLVGRARAPIASLLLELVTAADAAEAIETPDVEAAAYVLLTLSSASTNTSTLGNDVGVAPSAPAQVVGFCLRGLGADMTTDWYASVGGRLRLPAAPRRRKRAATA
ncbi:TetR/AcrR family transcriptional regulator [Aquihabitans sp. McL0605]|uniref:TetR/AcrR family transcriptional regulator n=1 Tax=Aquihabitans sp. McL0605 TaxID=3415671 RepID=UPI003CFA3719